MSFKTYRKPNLEERTKLFEECLKQAKNNEEIRECIEVLRKRF